MDTKHQNFCRFLDGQRGADSLLPSDKPYPETGSSKPEFKYMWCQPGTSTYIFFYYPETSPPPTDWYDINTAFNKTHEYASIQKDLRIVDGGLTVNPTGTFMQIHMENYNDGEFTWGIAGSALLGLTYLTKNYPGNCNNVPNGACGPMIFQVNDGDWGEIGIGYAALYREVTEECILKVSGGNKAETTHCDKLSEMIS